MLDKLTRRIMDSFHRSAQDTIIPMKNAMKKNVDTQVNVGSGILKLSTMILLFFGILKISGPDDNKPKPEMPGTIIINNYIREREVEQKE